jgi:hypothetical protein
MKMNIIDWYVANVFILLMIIVQLVVWLEVKKTQSTLLTNGNTVTNHVTIVSERFIEPQSMDEVMQLIEPTKE